MNTSPTFVLVRTPTEKNSFILSTDPEHTGILRELVTDALFTLRRPTYLRRGRMISDLAGAQDGAIAFVITGKALTAAQVEGMLIAVAACASRLLQVPAEEVSVRFQAPASNEDILSTEWKLHSEAAGAENHVQWRRAWARSSFVGNQSDA